MSVCVYSCGVCLNYDSCVTDFLLSGSKQEDGGSPLSPLSYPMLPSYPALQTQVIMVVCKLSPLRGFVCGVCLRVCACVCMCVSERESEENSCVDRRVCHQHHMTRDSEPTLSGMNAHRHTSTHLQ